MAMGDRTKLNQESFNKGPGEPGMTGPKPNAEKWDTLDEGSVKANENQMAGPFSRQENYVPTGKGNQPGKGISPPPNSNRRWK